MLSLVRLPNTLAEISLGNDKSTSTTSSESGSDEEWPNALDREQGRKLGLRLAFVGLGIFIYCFADEWKHSVTTEAYVFQVGQEIWLRQWSERSVTLIHVALSFIALSGLILSGISVLGSLSFWSWLLAAAAGVAISSAFSSLDGCFPYQRRVLNARPAWSKDLPSRVSTKRLGLWRIGDRHASTLVVSELYAWDMYVREDRVLDLCAYRPNSPEREPLVLDPSDLLDLDSTFSLAHNPVASLPDGRILVDSGELLDDVPLALRAGTSGWLSRRHNEGHGLNSPHAPRLSR